MESRLLLGIDIGTTRAKGVLLEPSGRMVAEATSAAYSTCHPQEGWAEQDAWDWWKAVCSVCRDLSATHDLGRVTAAGISGQGCACTLVDSAGSPLRPAIIWLDTRSHREADRMMASWGAALLAGNGNSAAPYNVEPKLLWLKEHEPDVLASAAAVLTTTSFVNSCLTGVFAANVADGGILHGYDHRSGEWNTSLLTELGIEHRLYPPLSECSSIVGSVTQDAARLTGLPVGTPVIAGGEDTPSAALSVGAVRPGDAFLSLGTAAVAGVCLDQRSWQPEPTMLTYPHVIPDVLIRSGSMSSAGAAVEWWLNAFGAEDDDVGSFSRSIEQSEPGAGALIFLPYLSGELHPILDPAARGVFFGLSLTTSAHDMARAIVEGNAMAIRHNLGVAIAHGEMPSSLRTTGGPSRSRAWCQAIADVTNLRVEVADSGGAPVGDAILAGMGVGLIATPESILANAVTITDVYEPNPLLRDQYDAMYALFRRLYVHLRDDFGERQRLVEQMTVGEPVVAQRERPYS